MPLGMPLAVAMTFIKTNYKKPELSSLALFKIQLFEMPSYDSYIWPSQRARPWFTNWTFESSLILAEETVSDQNSYGCRHSILDLRESAAIDCHPASSADKKEKKKKKKFL